MRTVAVLPLNRLNQAKSRLAFADLDRSTLALDLLRRIVCLLGQVEEVTTSWVVCPDPELASQVPEAEWITQTSQGLNPALEEARQRAAQQGFERVLVILPDLPFLESEEIRRFLSLADAPGTVALGADRWNSGTNLWASHLGDNFPFLFGEGSLAAHQQAAQERALSCHIFESPGSGRDLDTVEDWEEYRWNLPSNCCR